MIPYDQTMYTRYNETYSFDKLKEIFEYCKETKTLKRKGMDKMLNNKKVVRVKGTNYSVTTIIKTLIDGKTPNQNTYLKESTDKITHDDFRDSPRFVRRSRSRDLPKGVSTINKRGEIKFQALVSLVDNQTGKAKLHNLGVYDYPEDAEYVCKLSIETGRPIKLTGKYFKF